MQTDRRSTLFRRRLVIALPDWSVFVMAGAVVFGLVDKPLLVTNIIALVCCVIAVVCVWVARKSVRKLRHDVHEALNNIGYAYDEVEEEIGPTLKDYEPEKFHLKRMNGERSSRVSEH